MELINVTFNLFLGQPNNNVLSHSFRVGFVPDDYDTIGSCAAPSITLYTRRTQSPFESICTEPLSLIAPNHVHQDTLARARPKCLPRDIHAWHDHICLCLRCRPVIINIMFPTCLQEILPKIWFGTETHILPPTWIHHHHDEHKRVPPDCRRLLRYEIHIHYPRKRHGLVPSRSEFSMYDACDLGRGWFLGAISSFVMLTLILPINPFSFGESFDSTQIYLGVGVLDSLAFWYYSRSHR